MNDSQFKKLQGWFETLNNGQDELKQRFDGLEQRFDGLEYKFEGLEEKVDRLETEMRAGFDAVHHDLMIIKSSTRRAEARLAFVESTIENLFSSDVDQQKAILDVAVRVGRLEERVDA